jgi:16S rRNA (cytidine1402-2'-O)-methyltransferase
MPGTLFVVATPIGNLEDITIRALRVLRSAAVIAAEDTRRTARLLVRHAITTPTTSLHEHNEAQKTPGLIARLLAGDDVALVSDAGTPTVSDPGSYLVREASRAGIRVEPIPGASAPLAALSISGLSAQSFAFFGFPPIRAKDRSAWFERLINFGSIAIFFEAPHRIQSTLTELRQRLGDIDVLVTRELTKAHEKSVKGQISTLLEQLGKPRGEHTVVVDLGQLLKSAPVQSQITPQQLLSEFGDLTKTIGSTRRQAISALAKRHGIRVNDIYEALELARKSGN